MERYYGKWIDNDSGMLEVSRYIHLNSSPPSEEKIQELSQLGIIGVKSEQ